MSGGPTAKQYKYLEGLLIDCGFSDRVQRNAYLTRVCYRKIITIEDLSVGEASVVIDDLVKIKEDKWDEGAIDKWEHEIL